MKGKKQKKKLSDQELLAVIQHRSDTGTNHGATSLSEHRESILNRYYGELYGDEREGQSQVVTRQVLEAVEWTIPDLMEIFLSAKSVAEFEPRNAQEEAAAEQETYAVNKVVRGDNGFMSLFLFLKDILLSPVAYCKVYWDEKETVEVEEYSELDMVAAAELLADDEVEPLEQEFVEKEVSDGVNTFQIPVLNLKIKRVTKRGKVVYELIPPNEITVDGKVKNLALDDADFVSHDTQKTRSDLIAMGFDEDVVYSLKKYEELDSEDTTRRELSEGEDAPEGEDSNDESTELVELRETYLKIDYDGDGIAELRKVYTSGTEILENDYCNYLPIVSSCSVPMPHVHVGQAWAALVMDLQKIYTVLTRQLLNNTYRVNNPRPIVGRGVNMSDVMNDLSGAPIRAQNVDQLREHTVPPIVGSMSQVFEILDNMKETRTGVTKNTMGLDSEHMARVVKDAVQGTARRANKRLKTLARIIAESGMKPIMLKAHQCLRTNYKGTLEMKKDAEWMAMDPSKWPYRDDMNVSVGLGTGNSGEEFQSAVQLIDRQLQLQQATGGRLVTEKNLYNSHKRLTEISGLPAADLYFTNPDNLPPRQPPPPDPAIEVQKEFNKNELLKAELKYKEAMAKQAQEGSRDQNKLLLEVAKLKEQLRDKDRKYTLEEHKIMLDSEAKQAELDQKDRAQLEAAQNSFRSEM